MAMVRSRTSNRFTKLRFGGEALEARRLMTSNVEPVVQIEGEVATIIGQATDDTVELSLDTTTHNLNFAGHQFSFDASVSKEFYIAGGIGANAIRIYGSELEDTGKLIGARGTVTSSLYRVETFQFTSTAVVGGGGEDFVEIFGSSGDDEVQAFPGDVILESAASTLGAEDFEEVT